MKTGLVLEGGAMRGMFTAGVLDVLMEHGIVLDGAIGVSAGAVFGCNYKSHQIGRTIRYNTEYCTDKRYASFGNLLRTGNLYSEQFCYHTVPEKLDIFDSKAFRENPMDFFVVCTEHANGTVQLDVMLHQHIQYASGEHSAHSAAFQHKSCFHTIFLLVRSKIPDITLLLQE